MAHVLVATPTWINEDGRPAMQPECASSVAMQVFDGTFEHLVTTDNPYPPPSNRNVFHQYVRIRETFLAGDWDALLCVEHDNQLQDDNVLQRMYDTDAEVVYAPYMLRHGMRVLSTFRWLGPKYSNLGSSMTSYDTELQQARQKGVWPVSGVGFGCTLMRRSVVERIPFREWVPMTVSAPDMPFAKDCLDAGIVPMGRFDAPVLHWDLGEWIDPYEAIMNKEYRAVVTVNAMTAGEFIALKEGNTYPLSREHAYDLIRLGYIQEVTEDAAGSADTHAQTAKPAAEKPAKSGRKPARR